MPTGAVIGALRVVIGADSAALDKGLKDAQGSLRGFGTQVAAIASGIGLERIIENATAALVGGVKHALTLADDLGKAAQKVGLPVEELSKLKFAADLADVSFESLSKGLIRFDKGLSEAAAGGSNDFAKALVAMGISLRDSSGAVKDQGTILGEVADKFAGYEDGANKTALALKILGKGGADLVPLLNQGAKGLEEAGIQAAKTGNIITSDTAAAAEHFNDTIKILNANTTGFANAIAKGAIPALNDLATVMEQNSGGVDKFNSVTQVTQGIMRGLAGVFVLVSQGISNFSQIWIALVQSIGLAASGEFSKARDVMAAVGTSITTGIIESSQKAYDLWTGKFIPAAISLDQVLKAVYGTIAKQPAPGGDASAKNALQSFIDTQLKANAVQEASIGTVGKSVDVQTRQKVILEAQAIAANDATINYEAYRKKVEEVAGTSGSLALQLEGARLKFENLDPLVAYQTQLGLVEGAMKSVGATAEQIARAQTKVADQFGVSWTAVGTQIAGTAGALSQFTATFGKENKTLLALSKALGIGQAIINTQVGITKALTLPPPADIAGIAFAVATGAAAIAAIAAQGMAQGGSFRIPGGTSLTDSQMVPLSLAAGERVDVSPASAGGGGSTINIDMRDRDPYYSRANVERLLDAMHTVTEDGHQVRLVVLK